MASTDMFREILENSFFRNIESDELSNIDLSLFHKKNASSGEVLIREGTPGDEILLLLEGEVVINKKFSDGSETVIGTIRQGEFFGEMAIIEGRERSASVQCLTPCRLAALKNEDFFLILKGFPKLINNIASIMATRLRESDTLRTSVTEKNIELDRLNNEIREREKELEAQKEQLELLNKTKDSFFTIISHDLKNPLTTIVGLSSLLSETAEEVKPDQIMEYSEIISSASLELANLLDNLLEWAMSQTGRMSYRPEVVSLEDLASESLKMLVPNAKAKNIELKTEIDGQTSACVDKNMISTVIRNVTSNAIKFTPLGGKVTLKVEGKENFLQFSINDTGAGISDENLEKLFMPDRNFSSKGTAGEKGFGIGLTLSKEFIDVHKGEIWAESQLGKGTSVRFTLPHSKK